MFAAALTALSLLSAPLPENPLPDSRHRIRMDFEGRFLYQYEFAPDFRVGTDWYWRTVGMGDELIHWDGTPDFWLGTLTWEIGYLGIRQDLTVRYLSVRDIEPRPIRAHLLKRVGAVLEFSKEFPLREDLVFLPIFRPLEYTFDPDLSEDDRPQTWPHQFITVYGVLVAFEYRF